MLNYRNASLGSAGVSGRSTGPVTDQGAPTTASVGQLNQGGAPAGGAPVQTALPPGVGEAQQAVGEASGRQLAGDLVASNNFRRSIYPLEQAIPALEQLGTTGTGPGTDQLNQVKSFLQSLGLPGFDQTKIKNYDEANKYLTDFVNQTGNSGTNDKLAAAFAGNPSTKISNAAAVDVAKSALALRRMQQAQVLQFQASGLPEAQYSKWASSWQNRQDPRAYGFDQMSPETQQKLVGSLKGPERQKFLESLQVADQNGVINRPQPPESAPQ